MREVLSAPRRQLQFRLSTILLLIVIIGLGAGQIVTMRRALDLENRNRDLEAINQKLRAEAGYLEVSDPANPVVLLRNLDERTWEWKVWLPAGKWYLSGMTQDIPSKDVPKGPSVGPIDGDREVLAYATVRKGDDGQWHFKAGMAGMEIGNVVDESNWLIRQLPKHAESVDIRGDKGQVSFGKKQPVLLMRLRGSRNRANSKRRLGIKGRPSKEQRWSHGLVVPMTRRVRSITGDRSATVVLPLSSCHCQCSTGVYRYAGKSDRG